MTRLNSRPTQFMETDDFEQKLREQPFRELPQDWRKRILPTAQARPREVIPLLAARALRARLASLLWPAPKAWAGLALVWLLLALSNRLPSNLASGFAGKGSRPSPAAVAAWKEEERILAELIQPPELAVPETPKQNAPQPRSEVLGPYRTI